MSTASLDPRVNAYSPDLADARLRGRVEAAAFVEGMLKRIVSPSAALRRVPRDDTPIDTELLAGEAFLVFGDRADGWSWGQNQTDDYVGFLKTRSLGPSEPVPTHRVVALRTFIYPKPEMKLPPVAALSMGAEVAIGGEAETRGTHFRLLAGTERAIVASHLEPLSAPPAPDYVAVAETFLNVPYLWGGRTGSGVDCSSLVQLSLMMAGMRAPRDTDMQMAAVGEPVAGGFDDGLRRGDLLFWPAHVAIVAAPDRIVHASGHHMTVVTEPLAVAVARINAIKGPPSAIKRVLP